MRQPGHQNRRNGTKPPETSCAYSVMHDYFCCYLRCYLRVQCVCYRRCVVASLGCYRPRCCLCRFASHRVVCPRRYVGCYLRCHRRCWTLVPFVVTCVVTCVCCVRVTAAVPWSLGCSRLRCCLRRFASHTWCDRAAMLVVTCDVTGAAGPLSLLLLPALLPVCAACVLPPLCPALLPATLRIACVV